VGRSWRVSSIPFLLMRTLKQYMFMTRHVIASSCVPSISTITQWCCNTCRKDGFTSHRRSICTVWKCGCRKYTNNTQSTFITTVKKALDQYLQQLERNLCPPYLTQEQYTLHLQQIHDFVTQLKRQHFSASLSCILYLRDFCIFRCVEWNYHSFFFFFKY